MPRQWPEWNDNSARDKVNLFIAMGYRPHVMQRPFHMFDGKLMVVHGGWRSGKSEGVGREISVRTPWCAPGAGGAGNIAVCAQEYDETHAEMLCIAQGLKSLGMLRRFSNPKSGKWQIKAGHGVTIETISLQDGPDELSGTGYPFDIVALVEWGLIREDMMTAALGRVSEVDGIVIAAGTLRDTIGWQADLFRMLEAQPNVYQGARFSFPTWVNSAIYPGGEQDEKIQHLKRTLPEAEYARVVAAEIRPSPARIYPEFSFATHVGDVKYDSRLPVELAVDAGYSPSHYAVLALQTQEEVVELPSGSMVRMEVVRQIDEVWENGLVHEEVYNLCKQREWWGAVKRIVLGHEGKQHHAAESTQEVWEALLRADGKRSWVEVFNAGRVLDGILRVKSFLKDPATGASRFTLAPHCTGTQHEFQAYQRKTNRKGEVRSDEPKDADNDCMDALRNWMVAKYGFVERFRPKRKRQHRARPARG
jgi:hypothetical protein